jgi:hypothetical protein
MRRLYVPTQHFARSSQRAARASSITLERPAPSTPVTTRRSSAGMTFILAGRGASLPALGGYPPSTVVRTGLLHGPWAVPRAPAPASRSYCRSRRQVRADAGCRASSRSGRGLGASGDARLARGAAGACAGGFRPLLRFAPCGSASAEALTVAGRRREQRATRCGPPSSRCLVAWNAIAGTRLLLSTDAGARWAPIARRRTNWASSERACVAQL